MKILNFLIPDNHIYREVVIKYDYHKNVHILPTTTTPASLTGPSRTYKRRSEDVLNVLRTSYARSIYVLSSGGQTYLDVIIFNG